MSPFKIIIVFFIENSDKNNKIAHEYKFEFFVKFFLKKSKLPIYPAIENYTFGM